MSEAPPAFIGVDLAWADRNKTGIARLEWEDGGLALMRTSLVGSDQEILATVRDAIGTVCVLGIDAPIIAPNQPGTARPCDREVTRVFGRYHAGAYPANRERCARPIRLRRRLEALGFSPDPRLEPRQACRRQVEVFPHPAQVVLFGRDRIVKYKKGPVAARRAGLRELATCIRDHLLTGVPRLLRTPVLDGLLSTDVEALRGGALKGFEDRLDALICAFVAGYYWYWGAARCQVYGDVSSGYIICPRPD